MDPATAYRPGVARSATIDEIPTDITRSATDESTGLTFTPADDAGGLFEIVGNELRVKGQLDFETASSHAVNVVVSDGVNEPPRP